MLAVYAGVRWVDVGADRPCRARRRSAGHEAELLQDVADPVGVALEAALALRSSGADPKALRRALRRDRGATGRVAGAGRRWRPRPGPARWSGLRWRRRWR